MSEPLIHLNSVTRKENDGSSTTGFDTPWGPLSSAPTTAEGFEEVDVFLFSRALRDGSTWRGQVMHITGDELTIEFDNVTYGPWKLFPNELRWSDGPPHPDKLMLAVRSA